MTMIWCQSAIEEEYTEAKIVSEQWFRSGISVFDCKPVQGRFPDVTLEIRWENPPADYFEPGTLFTVSSRLKLVLEEFNVRAEFFPLRIIYCNNVYNERSFYFCNILDCVNCFDHINGDFIFESKPGFTHLVHQIRKLAISEDKAQGHDLFRIANGGQGLVCVSDKLASKLTAGKFTGVRFVEPEKWKFGMVVI